jgi:hypothetical protein
MYNSMVKVRVELGLGLGLGFGLDLRLVKNDGRKNELLKAALRVEKLRME